MAKKGSRGVGRSGSAVYSVRVPADLRSDWDAYLEENNEDAAEALRTLMRHLVKHRQPAFVQDKQSFLASGEMAATDQVDTSPKKPVKIRFTESELEALYRVADQHDCSIQFWIIALVRAALTNGTAIGGAELQALGKSNYQLAAMGRNLNQVVHHINADPTKNLHRVTERSIERLTNAFEQHRQQVHAVIAANTQRWVLQPKHNARPE